MEVLEEFMDTGMIDLTLDTPPFEESPTTRPEGLPAFSSDESLLQHVEAAEQEARDVELALQLQEEWTKEEMLNPSGLADDAAEVGAVCLLDLDSVNTRQQQEIADEVYARNLDMVLNRNRSETNVSRRRQGRNHWASSSETDTSLSSNSDFNLDTLLPAAEFFEQDDRPPTYTALGLLHRELSRQFGMQVGGRRRSRGRGRMTGRTRLDNTGEDDYEELWNLAESLGDAKPKGLKEGEINSLPTAKFQRTSSASSAVGKDESETSCRICFSEYEANDTLRTLPCLHRFHKQCIDQWIKRNAICPVCRVKIKDQLKQ